MASGEATSNPTKIDFDEIFQKSTDQAVDFEIVFAGLLATSLLSVSGISPILDLLSVAGAISLLFFTMVRRMAFDNPFALEDQLMDISLTVIFAVTFFGVVYLAAFPAELIREWSSVNYYLSVGVLLFLSILGILLLYEYVFRDFFLWAGVLFYNRHIEHRGEKMGDLLLKSAKSTLRNLSFTSYEDMPDQVTGIYDIKEGENTTRGIYSYIGIVVGIVVFVLLLVLIGNFVRLVVAGRIFRFGIVLVLLIASLMLLTGTVEFWFSRYGNAPFKDLTDWKRRMINWLLAFFTIVVSDPDILDIL